MRDEFTSDRDYYVDTNGDDAADGSAAHPRRTIQSMFDHIQRNCDMRGFAAAVHLVDNGPHLGGLALAGPFVGQTLPENLQLIGNPFSMSDRVVEGGIQCLDNARLYVRGIKGQNASSLFVTRRGGFLRLDLVDFGEAADNHFIAGVNSEIEFDVSGFRISGSSDIFGNASGCGAHWQFKQYTSFTVMNSVTIGCFLLAAELALININGVSFSNANLVTGQKYSTSYGGRIVATGYSPSNIPGNAAGTGDYYQ